MLRGNTVITWQLENKSALLNVVHGMVKGKGKGKVHPRTGHESLEGNGSIALLFL